ncbi:MAG: di-trans,poly-cis-decaprenylcistransferase [Puniceicoccales bacterium]|jgi:undecaprenyl diphosphate synthase|nr:di-trans,poly-cis-decaprenylcistransferase [Puniceicoccales bacterium]
MPLPIPVHVAIVMDGNRRWAKKNNYPIFRGHRRGARRAAEIAAAALKHNIAYLSLFAFSSENWKRSPVEINYLMRLFSRSIEHHTARLIGQEICVRFIGDLTPLNADLFQKIRSIQEKTQHGRKLFLTIGINYGSRDEIGRALRKIPPEEIANCSWETVQKHLDTQYSPDVDLFIRTSGEQRLSNFLLLQSAYAELVFVQKNWPEFTAQDFETILQEFGRRQRNFGK